MIMGENRFMGKTCLSPVDVRDASQGHIRALERGRSGERYILTNSDKGIFMEDVYEILMEEFVGSGYDIRMKPLPEWVMKLASVFSKKVKNVWSLQNRRFDFSNKKSIDELGMEYIDLRTSIVDMAHNLIDIGYLPDKRIK